MSLNEKFKNYLNQQIQQEKKRTRELQELLDCEEQIQKYREQAEADKEKIRKMEYTNNMLKENCRCLQRQLQEKEEKQFSLQQDIDRLTTENQNLKEHVKKLKYRLEAQIDASFLLENELQELKKKKVHKKIITFSPLSDSEIQKISQE